jgi:hypothetical protein
MAVGRAATWMLQQRTTPSLAGKVDSRVPGERFRPQTLPLGAKAELAVRAEAAEVARATAEAALAVLVAVELAVLVAVEPAVPVAVELAVLVVVELAVVVLVAVVLAVLAAVRLAEAAAWAPKVAPAEVAEAGLAARKQTPKSTRVLRLMLQRLTSRPMKSERRIRAVTVAARARSHTER